MNERTLEERVDELEATSQQQAEVIKALGAMLGGILGAEQARRDEFLDDLHDAGARIPRRIAELERAVSQ